MSQRLKALERAVGLVLLQRSRPVRPTEAGGEVLRLARQLDAITRDSEQSLGATASPRRVSPPMPRMSNCSGSSGRFGHRAWIELPRPSASRQTNICCAIR
ncbi:MAG: hypothetical protein QM650_13285 [Microlunatus sp.]